MPATASHYGRSGGVRTIGGGGGTIVYTSVSPNDIGGVPAGLAVPLASGQYADFWWTVVSGSSDCHVSIIVTPDGTAPDTQVTATAFAGFQSASGGGYFHAPSADTYTFSFDYDDSPSGLVLHVLVATGGDHEVVFGG